MDVTKKKLGTCQGFENTQKKKLNDSRTVQKIPPMDLGLIRKDTLYVTGSNIGRGQDDMVHNNCNSHGANCINNNINGREELYI